MNESSSWFDASRLVFLIFLLSRFHLNNAFYMGVLYFADTDAGVLEVFYRQQHSVLAFYIYISSTIRLRFLLRLHVGNSTENTLSVFPLGKSISTYVSLITKNSPHPQINVCNVYFQILIGKLCQKLLSNSGQKGFNFRWDIFSEGIFRPKGFFDRVFSV